MIGFLVFSYLIPGAKLINQQHVNSRLIGHLFDIATQGKSLFIPCNNITPDLIPFLSKCL